MESKFTVMYTLTKQQISDILYSTLEGGSNYWYLLKGKIEPTTWEFDSVLVEHKGHYLGDYPLNPGGALLICDIDEIDPEVRRLDLEAIQKGLSIMAEKFPHHFADILSEDADADTGDVFLQCCLFGDVIYG